MRKWFLMKIRGIVGVGERGGAGGGQDGEGEAGEGDCRSHLRGSDQVNFFLKILQIRIRTFLLRNIKIQFSIFLPT